MGWRAVLAATMFFAGASAFAQKPALIRDIDAPGRQAYVTRCVVGGTVACQVPAVPAGKRLTVTTLTVRLLFDNSGNAVSTPRQTAVNVDAYLGGNPVPGAGVIVPIPQISTCTDCTRQYGGTLDAVMFLDEGQALNLLPVSFVSTGGAAPPIGELMVTGYLTDK